MRDLVRARFTKLKHASSARRARKFAAVHNVLSVELGDLAAMLIVESVVPQAIVEAKLVVWDDVAQHQGRPKDWRTLATSFPERLRRVRG